MEKVLFQIPNFLGLDTRGDETEIVFNALRILENFVYKNGIWVRKSGRSIYNSTPIHATEEVRGLDNYTDDDNNTMVLAMSNGIGRKTTGDGSMGTDLTLPDGSAISFANKDLDVYAVEIRGLLYLFNGDTTDYTLMFNGTNLIDNSRYMAEKDATDGTTTTLIDTVNLTQVDTDYWEGLFIRIYDTSMGTYHRAWITAFDPATDKVTFSPAMPLAVVAGDTYEIAGGGIWQEKNGKYAILHDNRICVAIGSLLHVTERYWPDEWNAIKDSYPLVFHPGWKDGENITALASLDEYIVVFKPHNIYVIRAVGNPDSWSIIKIVGTDSNKGAIWHRTIDRGFGGLIYYSWDGVYVLTRDLNVRCVSRYIDPTIRALAQSISNPGGMSVVEVFDTTHDDFNAGTTKTHIDLTTEAGTFRVALTTEAVNQSFSTEDQSTNFINYSYAQSFKPSIDCTLTKVQLYLRTYVGSPPDFTVYLKSDNNNSPGGTLASKFVDTSEELSGTFVWVDINFPDTNLTATTRYWIYIPKHGDGSNFNEWAQNSSGGYDDGDSWNDGFGISVPDLNFKVYEQHYEPSPEFISQIHNLGAVPTGWRPFVATEVLNGCSIVWYVATDDNAEWVSPTAWVAVENGGVPDVAVQQYAKYRAVPSPTNIATPVAEDVTIQAYLGTAVNSPCGIVWNKGYELCVEDTGSDINNIVFRLDEDSWMDNTGPDGKPLERWTKKTGIEATKFIIFNDQVISGSVGGTEKGGFLYYEDVGTKDLGVDFTARLVTGRMDFSSPENPTFKEREKIFKEIFSKYKSQVNASLYYKIDLGSWSSAITLGAHVDAKVEQDWFRRLARGKCITLKYEQTVADPDMELHGFDIKGMVVKVMR